jgi:hypothetical protein
MKKMTNNIKLSELPAGPRYVGEMFVTDLNDIFIYTDSGWDYIDADMLSELNRIAIKSITKPSCDNKHSI